MNNVHPAFADTLLEICDPNAEPARRIVLLASVDNAVNRIGRCIDAGKADAQVASIALEELRKIFAARRSYAAVQP